MKQRGRKKGTAGMTLIEVIIASLVLAIVGTATIASVSQLFKAQRRVRDLTTEDRLVSGLVSSIRSNVGAYPVSPYYADDTADCGNAPCIDVLLNDLPLGYSNTTLMQAGTCPGCAGRIGFAIQPVQNMPSLCRITVRLVNTQLYGGKYGTYSNGQYGTATFKEFRFLASY